MSWLLAFVIASTSFCPVTAAPVDGAVVEPFAPVGRYAGHWGIDFAAPLGTDVRAPVGGTVSFAGSVAGRLSVSIDHGRGMVTSLSYLSEVLVRRGQRVVVGETVAHSGVAHGRDAVHLSLRIDGTYVDPGVLFSCLVGDISDALRLTAAPG